MTENKCMAQHGIHGCNNCTYRQLLIATGQRWKIRAPSRLPSTASDSETFGATEITGPQLPLLQLQRSWRLVCRWSNGGDLRLSYYTASGLLFLKKDMGFLPWVWCRRGNIISSNVDGCIGPTRGQSINLCEGTGQIYGLQQCTMSFGITAHV